MERETVEKFKSENRPIWFMGIWTALPIEGMITEICEDERKGTYVKVDYIPDKEYGNHAFREIFLEDLFPSKEYMYKAMYEHAQAKTAEIRASIRTKDDCIRFLYNNNVSNDGIYTDWISRRAIKEIAKERWGLDLE